MRAVAAQDGGEVRRISIIVPMLNEAAHVEHLVGDIAAQDWNGELELIVADGGSDDGSPEKRQFTLAPRARDAYRVNDLLKDTAFSASFRADQDVVVERTIMTEGERPPTVKRSREDKGPNVMANGQTDDSFAMARNANGIFGGLGYVGSGANPGLRTWEFAEGSTRGPYATFSKIDFGNGLDF